MLIFAYVIKHIISNKNIFLRKLFIYYLFSTTKR